jgi:hypothetical protein
MRSPSALQANAHTGTHYTDPPDGFDREGAKSIDGLNLWSVKAWDYTGDWLNGTWDSDDGELALDETEPERMECDAIVVSDDDCHWEAYVNNCDIHCETEYVNISDLEATSVGCACDNTPNPK